MNNINSRLILLARLLVLVWYNLRTIYKKLDIVVFTPCTFCFEYDLKNTSKIIYVLLFSQYILLIVTDNIHLERQNNYKNLKPGFIKLETRSQFCLNRYTITKHKIYINTLKPWYWDINSWLCITSVAGDMFCFNQWYIPHIV